MAWHRTCLVCNICGKDFSDGTQPDEGADGFAYCHNDYVETFIPKCGACGKQIEGQVIEAMAKKWHPEHFVCNTCKCKLAGTFYPGDDGLPYCEKHFYEMRGLLCPDCERPILTGKAVPFNNRKYHPEHFRCTHCKTILTGQAFLNYKEKPYCKKCHTVLFG